MIDDHFQAALVIFTIHTCSLASFHTWHNNGGIDGLSDSDADGGHAILMTARRHTTLKTESGALVSDPLQSQAGIEKRAGLQTKEAL